jgi:hypothetical protein
MDIPVRDFTFISDPSKTMMQGFIAQELYMAYPQAVTVGDADVTKKPWAVDYGMLTPLLVKSVQELKAANDNLVTENQRLRSTLEEQGRRLKRVERMLEAMGQ